LVFLLLISSQIVTSIQVHKKKVHFDDTSIKTAKLDEYNIVKTYQRPDTQYYTYKFFLPSNNLAKDLDSLAPTLSSSQLACTGSPESKILKYKEIKLS
jgi:hypothetical protein